MFSAYYPKRLEYTQSFFRDCNGMFKRHLATQPTRALGLTKRAFNHSMGIDLDSQLDYEEELQREAGQTRDYTEGVQALLAKRKPTYTGQ